MANQALFEAIRQNNVGSVRSLLDYRPDGHKRPIDVNSRNVEGQTALGLAVSLGNFPVCQLLIAHLRVNVNIPDIESGYTPLHRVSCARKREHFVGRSVFGCDVYE